MKNANANYDVLRIDLSTAGTQWIERAFDFIRIARFEDANLNEVLTGKLSVTFGRQDSEAIPLGPNGGAKGNGDVAKLTWTAQSGVYAIVVASRGDLQIDTPPARSLVSSASGNAIRTVATTVTSSATSVSSVSGRQSVVLYNDGSVDCYIGGSTVTASGATKGILLQAGRSITLDKQTAAVYAITASSTTSIVALEEYST